MFEWRTASWVGQTVCALQGPLLVNMEKLSPGFVLQKLNDLKTSILQKNLKQNQFWVITPFCWITRWKRLKRTSRNLEDPEAWDALLAVDCGIIKPFALNLFTLIYGSPKVCPGEVWKVRVTRLLMGPHSESLIFLHRSQSAGTARHHSEETGLGCFPSSSQASFRETGSWPVSLTSLPGKWFPGELHLKSC